MRICEADAIYRRTRCLIRIQSIEMLACLVVAIAIIATGVSGSPDPRYVCSFRLIGLGLVEQSLLQIDLENALVAAKCPTDGKI